MQHSNYVTIQRDLYFINQSNIEVTIVEQSPLKQKTQSETAEHAGEGLFYLSIIKILLINTICVKCPIHNKARTTFIHFVICCIF